jgi:TetR/AcrR family transcriptional repressor of bet genes
MPRPSNTHERRQQIVQGLLQVMAVEGYKGASIQAIGQAAGLNPGLVHYHFKNKQQVLLQAIEELGSRVLARFEAKATGADEPWGRLFAFVDAHLAKGEDADPQAVVCWVAIGAEATRQEDVRAAYQGVVRAQLELLRALLTAVLQHEGRSEERVDELAAGLLSAIQGSFQLAVTADVTPTGFAAPTVRRMAEGLVRAEAPAP